MAQKLVQFDRFPLYFASINNYTIFRGKQWFLKTSKE
jgi:hypothetical protein